MDSQQLHKLRRENMLHALRDFRYFLVFMALLMPTAFAQEIGLIQNDPRAYQGYTTFSPADGKTYLIDMEGRVVHQWDSPYSGGNSGYLLPNGNLLRGGAPDDEHPIFDAGGSAGRVHIVSWDGELLWNFNPSSDTTLTHHDLEPMPNGNVLMLRFELKTEEEVLAAGRTPEHAGDLWPDSIIEIKPTGKTTGEIVWEWHLWDHLVQDTDPDLPNYGNLADHPERININPIDWLGQMADADREALEALGYLDTGDEEDSEDDGDDEEEDEHNPDWNHTNAIDYNAELDQIAISVVGFNELLIIDHSTTTEEAAGSTGGRYGKGGDILYRWGNPRMYRAGEEEDQTLFFQHNVQWIAPGLSGEGHLLVFNNGRDRADGSYSTVDEIITPHDGDGNYHLEPGKAFGPDKPHWTYKAPNPEDFYSSYISGAQRLPNGNTFICSGANGTFFEVTHEGDIVWKYVNPMLDEEDEDDDGDDGDDDSDHDDGDDDHDDEGHDDGDDDGDQDDSDHDDDDGDDDGDDDDDDRRDNPVFRATRYGLDYPAFIGRDLTPGKTLEQIIAENAEEEDDAN
jgi:hypothetical protein